MPVFKKKHYCIVCGAVSENIRCPLHKAEYDSRMKDKREKYFQALDDRRESSAKRGYGARWRKYRLTFLSRNPVCAICGMIATVVDHIIPHQGNYGLFWDYANHQALCKSCHDHKTVTADRRIKREKNV